MAMGKTTKYAHRHKDGSVEAKGHILNSTSHGLWIWFRKDGSKMRSGSFDKGKQIGKWTMYDKSGKVYKVTHITK